MNFLESLQQLKAFARQDGAILALVWIVAFLFTMQLPQSMVGNLLTLSTPFVVAWRLRAFRNNALDGEISYRRALAYSWHTFVYASLIFALAQYLYIRFYDPESLITMMRDSIHSFSAAYQQMGKPKCKSRLSSLAHFNPSSWCSFSSPKTSSLVFSSASLLPHLE